MTRIIVNFVKQLAVIGVLAASLYGTRAEAQIMVYPPAEWLATSTPVYYEGRPAYWWGNRWYYRNGAGWGYYHDEPGYLRDYRGRPGWGGRRFYEGHGNARGGHWGGGRRR